MKDHRGRFFITVIRDIKINSVGKIPSDVKWWKCVNSCMQWRCRYLGMRKAISSSESLGCRGARSNSLLGFRWTWSQLPYIEAVGWCSSLQLCPRCCCCCCGVVCPCPPKRWRFFRAASSSRRRKLCSRKKNTDILAVGSGIQGQLFDTLEGYFWQMLLILPNRTNEWTDSASLRRYHLAF